MENKINKFLEELIQEIENDLDEATTSGAAGAYSTPNAFSDNGSKDKNKKKKIATQLGMKLVGKVNEGISVSDERHFGKKGIIIMIDDNGKKVSAIFKDKKNADKFNRNNPSDIKKLLQLAKKTKFPKAIDESVNEAGVNVWYFYKKANKDKNKFFKMLSDFRKKHSDTEWIKMLNYALEDFNEKPTKYKTIDDKQNILFKNLQTNKKVYESVNEGKYNYKADALTAYFKGKIDAKELDKIARDDFKSGIATKKELSNFLSNKFTQDVMSDTYGIPSGTLIKRVRGLMKFAEGKDDGVPQGYNPMVESKVKRPINRWLAIKNDETKHPHKKMAMGLKELKHQLAETQKFFNWYNKIKTMNELDSNQYWKRTNKHIYKIKERLINIARTIQEIEK